MSSIIDQVSTRLQKLKGMTDQDKSSLAERDSLITQLRIDLTNFDQLPPATKVNMQQCILAREVYEYATLIAVEKEDIPAFERNFTVLKTYYDEFSNILPESQKKYSILGLYLLYLLSFNKIAEYHTEIEMIPYS